MEEENPFSSAKISIWWDIENCQVPKHFNANTIAHNIASALFNSNFHGPITISAYGDSTRLPSHVQHALSSTGISLNHVPLLSGAKDAKCDKKLLVDMLLWAVDNPAPANYLLISGDRNFSIALHQLRMRRYNVLLAQPFCASTPLVAAAEFVWFWPTLIAGGPPHKNATNNKLPNLIQSVQIQKPESDDDDNINNKNNDSSVINAEQSKWKLFRLAPHQYFKSNKRTIIPISTNLKSNASSNFDDSHDLHHNKELMLPISSCGYDESPILSASALIVAREDSKSISSSLTTSLKVDNNPNCGVDGGQEFCDVNLKERDSSSGGGSEQLLVSNVRRVKSLPTVSTYENLQGFVDVILVTLETLKNEMVFPTEGNITDCIRYGDPKYQTIDVKKALDCAIEQQRVVKKCYAALHLYVVANENLWKCVNPLGGSPHHFPDAVWVRIKKFLASSSGRLAILASRSRYEASLILKRLCLEELALGDVLKILEIIITTKKWIIPYHARWQPISISLPEAKDDN